MAHKSSRRNSAARLAPGGALTVHVVSHTHWDREWYNTAAVFRLRLVELMDDLLDSARRDATLRFLLDGQAVVVEDYLAVRPERRAELSRLLADGRLESGPWFVLADELTPSGEALVRNLLAGKRTLASLGARAPAVLYCADSFGHPASLPTIAEGFGCPVIVLWRGFGGRSHPETNCAVWRSAGGAAALLYHLPRAGYETGASLPADSAAAALRWEVMKSALQERDRVGVVLLPNGADHHALQRDYGAALRTLGRVAQPHKVVPSSLARFSRDLLRRARSAELPVVEGELRDSYGYTWTLQGTFASRSSLKRSLASATRHLTREAEPWSALAARASEHSRRHLVNAAWKSLLLALPHDTICGCSTDEVAQEAAIRLRDAEAQARQIARWAIESLSGYDTDKVRDEPNDPSRDQLVLLNPAARRRGGVAEVSVVRKLRDVLVGSGSALQPAPMREPKRLPGVAVPHNGGRARTTVQTPRKGATAVRFDLIESSQHYPDQDLVEEERLLVWIPEIPGYGIAPLSRVQSRGPVVGPANESRAEKGTISNGLISAGVEENGRIWLRSEGEKRRVTIAFEDQADQGDLYTPSLRGPISVAKVATNCKVIARGPLRSALRMTLRFSTRVDNTGDSLIVTGGERRGGGKRAGRRSGQLPGPLSLEISIDADSRVVQLYIQVDNQLSNHRLRLVISGDMKAATVAADGAFGVAMRPTTHSVAVAVDEERPLRGAPLHRHITILNTIGAATIFSDGAGEYEYDETGRVSLSLLRAIGELSRHDLPERPGNAGWPVATPGAQELGKFSSRFGWMAHEQGTWNAVAANVERFADEFLHPIRGITLRSAQQAVSATAGVELEGNGLSLSAIKESEDGRSLVLRCVNLTDRPVKGRWRLGERAKSAYLARLDETTLKKIAVVGGSEVPFAAAAHGVVTILVR